MKLSEAFITHESAEEHITVTTGGDTFNGLVRSNKTAGFIVECLKDDVTKEDIVDKMLEKYDAPREVIEKDVEMVLETLRKIGAIND